ncbi:endodeoxyribonuclease RusA family protein [[Clostridium] bifermentans ATCC 638]|uniref:Endodeoxyribonuclease RusA family protein n=1 Tax=Paraclostridium bifermentans ATCC 638 = DSM 14991 TaxID=1233171 RepID=T4VE57_PARBF|nr:RusA family crossover junction endodeoxyribonuclease [Paraclostridium bifermentans]EQK39778.1 endodeoxyribonuclease RusA family protein [[Clostridium] bifermentans ATCC 638] [Paraclostridium bifermentans ATCC 638 = DSM 14991]RIZ57435.1 RusA family crossover junction endodeoxyribonuclease [Paraclostridium bifermentans]
MIRINTIPVPKARPRMNTLTGRTYTPSKTKNFEEYIAFEYKKQGGKYFDDKPIKLKLGFGFKVPKSYTKKDKQKALEGQIIPSKCDIDNLVKCVQDGLNTVAYKDDRYIYAIEATKKFDNEDYIEIEIV